MDFRDCFKYYKSRCPEPSFDEVVDVRRSDDLVIFKSLSQSLRDRETESALGIGDRDFLAFEVQKMPDFLILRNPFTPPGVRSLVDKCLTNYPCSPETRNNMENQVILSSPWWEHCKKCPKDLKKLRWVTLGYHHDWDTKVYSEDRRGAFPEELGKLFKYLANVLGFGDYEPQAAIVNYYPWDATLAPHTDHSEVDFEAPLFSLSLGQSAIFLIGTSDKADKPTPIALHCGDVAVMYGKSRLAYHAVPKIFRASESPWFDEDAAEWMSEFGDYVENNRINLNVRQVLPCGMDQLPNR